MAISGGIIAEPKRTFLTLGNDPSYASDDVLRYTRRGNDPLCKRPILTQSNRVVDLIPSSRYSVSCIVSNCLRLGKETRFCGCFSHPGDEESLVVLVDSAFVKDEIGYSVHGDSVLCVGGFFENVGMRNIYEAQTR